MCGIVVTPMSTIACDERRAPGTSSCGVRRERVGRVGEIDVERDTVLVEPAQATRCLVDIRRAGVGAGEEAVCDAVAVPDAAGSRCVADATPARRARAPRGVRFPRGRRPRRASRARLPAREAADDARSVPALAERPPARVQPDDEPRARSSHTTSERSTMLSSGSPAAAGRGSRAAPGAARPSTGSSSTRRSASRPTRRPFCACSCCAAPRRRASSTSARSGCTRSPGSTRSTRRSSASHFGVSSPGSGRRPGQKEERYGHLLGEEAGRDEMPGPRPRGRPSTSRHASPRSRRTWPRCVRSSRRSESATESGQSSAAPRDRTTCHATLPEKPRRTRNATARRRSRSSPTGREPSAAARELGFVRRAECLGQRRVSLGRADAATTEPEDARRRP